MVATQEKVRARLVRHKRVRQAISGTSERPRLAVFRSNKHIYVQVIDDTAGRTIAAASTAEGAIGRAGAKKDAATRVGKAIAERARERGIETVVFDRGGRLYHGRVQALAEAAREAGLKF